MESLQIWTRFIAYSMYLVWIFTAIVPSLIENIFISLWFLSLVIATFVLSITHLRVYQEKGFAVTALVISSIGVLGMLVGMFTL